MENHSPLNCESAPLSAIACACRAIAAAEKAVPEMAAMASYERKEVLEHCVREFEKRFEDLAVSLCIEAGKPIKVTTSASPGSHPLHSTILPRLSNKSFWLPPTAQILSRWQQGPRKWPNLGPVSCNCRTDLFPPSPYAVVDV